MLTKLARAVALVVGCWAHHVTWLFSLNPHSGWETPRVLLFGDKEPEPQGSRETCGKALSWASNLFCLTSHSTAPNRGAQSDLGTLVPGTVPGTPWASTWFERINEHTLRFPGAFQKEL